LQSPYTHTAGTRILGFCFFFGSTGKLLLCRCFAVMLRRCVVNLVNVLSHTIKKLNRLLGKFAIYVFKEQFFVKMIPVALNNNDDTEREDSRTILPVDVEKRIYQ